MKKCSWLTCLMVVLTAACGDSDGDGTVNAPATYAFESRFQPGVSSVNYSGQIARHALMAGLDSYIEGLDESISNGSFVPAEGQVIDALNFFYRFDSDTSGTTAIVIATDPAVLQPTYNDISTDKNLVDKVAGNDSATDRKDWSTEFAGWSDPAIAAHGGSVTSPSGLMTAFFETIEHNAVLRAQGNTRQGPDGRSLPSFVTDTGIHLQELVEKFLLASLVFHQAADDYLDSDQDGKGLRSSNESAEEGKPYSALEHAWDEAFGYFGAARDYTAYTDDELAGAGGADDRKNGYFDTNADGRIDLLSEYNFTVAKYAARRDRTSKPEAPTDFTGDIYSAFARGRTIISESKGALSKDDFKALEKQRDIVLTRWEQLIGANAVHYINETLGQVQTLGASSFDFVKFGKAWSELKGFLLAAQFNPRSPLTSQTFAQMHAKIGDRPLDTNASVADIEAYKTALLEVRSTLQAEYGFAAVNVGDNDGKNGW